MKGNSSNNPNSNSSEDDEEHHVGGFDLIYDQGTGFKANNTYLGCYVKKPIITGARTMGKKPSASPASTTPTTANTTQPVAT